MLPQQTSDERVDQARTAGQLLKEGVVAFRNGDKAQARELIAQAAQLTPDNELVWMWTASTARNRAEALAALDRVLEINPNNAKAGQWLQKLRPTPKQEAGKSPTNGAVATAEVQGAEAEASPKLEQTAAKPAEVQEPAEEKAAAVAAVGEAAAEPQAAVEVREEPREEQVDDAPAQDQGEAPTEDATPESKAETSDPDPEPVRAAPPLEDDPIRALLRKKSGLPDAPAEEQTGQEQTGQEDTGQEQAAEVSGLGALTEDSSSEKAEEQAPQTAAEALEQTSETSVAESERTPSAERPISAETCLLCGKRSLTAGVCGFCKAVGDIAQLDEISRNEHVDRTVMLAAIDRFRKELETGRSFEANLGLALAYLNMKQSNDALPRLREACRLQPDNADLRHHYERLRARRLILVVDDSKTVQKMIAGVLEKELYRVALAEDGLQALARLDDETPALILLDITMPRMDGYQVARIITGNDATASIPVVMLSGKDGFFDRVRGKLAGARGYVTKPFDPGELTATIQRCLNE